MDATKVIDAPNKKLWEVTETFDIIAKKASLDQWTLYVEDKQGTEYPPYVYHIETEDIPEVVDDLTSRIKNNSYKRHNATQHD